jgi:hypothetical protein
MKIVRFISLVILLALTGCAANYRVVTNTYLDQSTGLWPPNASFAVVTNPSVPNPIFDREVKAKIEKLLRAKGYKVTSLAEADYQILFSYDISGRTETVSRHEYVTGPPIIQRFQVTGSNTYQTAVTAGYSYLTVVPETYTVYSSRFFIRVLDAKALQETKEEKVLWVGDTINESDTSDLRLLIDYLLVATFQYFGQNTGRNVEVTVPKNSPEVAALRT